MRRNSKTIALKKALLEAGINVKELAPLTYSDRRTENRIAIKFVGSNFDKAIEEFGIGILKTELNEILAKSGLTIDSVNYVEKIQPHYNGWRFTVADLGYVTDCQDGQTDIYLMWTEKGQLKYMHDRLSVDDYDPEIHETWFDFVSYSINMYKEYVLSTYEVDGYNIIVSNTQATPAE